MMIRWFLAGCLMAGAGMTALGREAKGEQVAVAGRKVQAGDWPQYKRDAARTGDAADEALAFPLARVMAVRFGSPIYASPAVVGGRVYVQDARGNVACVDAAANKPLWVTSIGGVANYSSPAVASGKVFVGSSAGSLAILDAGKGTVLKTIPAKGGVIAAPAIANEEVYFCTFNGEMLKVDFSGEVVWRISLGKACNQEFAVHGREIVVQTGPFSEDREAEPLVVVLLEDKGASVEVKGRYKRAELAKLDANDPKWRGLRFFGENNFLNTPILGLTVRGDRTYWRGMDVVICPQGEKGYHWYAGGWPDYEGGPAGYLSQPALSKEHVIVGADDGTVQFYSMKQDEKLIHSCKPAWMYGKKLPGVVNGGIMSSPAVAGGRVFFGGEDGVLTGLGQGKEAAVVPVSPEVGRARELPGKKLKGLEWVSGGGDMSQSMISSDLTVKPPFRVKWKTKLSGAGSQGSPVVADGKLFVASYNGRLEALDAETGEILWRTYHPMSHHTVGYGNDGPPTYAEGKVLVLRGETGAVKTTAKVAGLWCHDAATGKLLWHKDQPVLFPPAGAPMGDAVVATGGRALGVWHKAKGVLEAAAFDLNTGQEFWRREYADVLPEQGTGVIRVCQGALGEGAWYFSACRIPERAWNGMELDKSQGYGGATLAVDPKDGRLLWKNGEQFVIGFGGVNYREGQVMVYQTGKASHALSAKTGEKLWSIKWAPQHLQPLTDAFLKSKGAEGRLGGYCGDQVVAGNLSFGPYASSAHVLCVREQGKEVWRFVPLSRGCPTPALAYGRVYYVPFGEGVAYCFESAEGK